MPTTLRSRLTALAALFTVLALTTGCVAFGLPGQPPPGVKVIRDLAYVPGGDAAQVLDLYLPEQDSSKPLPLFVWIHGGGWMGGSKDGPYGLDLVGRGYAVASVEYRFSQKAIFPAQIQDCQAAIRWLRANSKVYNLDPKHIAVGGASAGGHLVALLGTAGGKRAFVPVGGNEKQSDRVQAVLDLFGPSDFSAVMSQAAADPTKSVFNFNHGDPYSLLIGVPLGSDKAKELAVSPIHYVSKDNPPFLVLHGTADSLVPFEQSVELCDALHTVRVEAILQRFTGAGHGGPAFDQPAVRKLVQDFLDKHLRGAAVKVEAIPGT